MPHAADLARLQALQERLARVLADKTWGHLAEVDQGIRSLLQELAEPARQTEAVRAASRRLQGLHAQAREACAEECERVRRLLLAHLANAEGRSAYQQINPV